jgi:hypothetical protein
MTIRRVIESEQSVEKFLVSEVKKRGGVAEKVMTIARRGFFDRVVVMPGGAVHFVELKSDRGRLSPHQKLKSEQYSALGANAHVLRGRNGVVEFLELLDKQNRREVS